MKNKHPKTFLTTLFLLCCATLSAHDFEVDGIYYNVTDKTNKTVEVTSGIKGYTGDVTIPASVTYSGTTYSVTTIGDYAFSICNSLTSVAIGNSVTNIGDEAFYGCTALNNIINLSNLN